MPTVTRETDGFILRSKVRERNGRHLKRGTRPRPTGGRSVPQCTSGCVIIVLMQLPFLGNGHVANQLVAAVSSGLAFAGTMSVWAFSAVSVPHWITEGSSVSFTQTQANWFISLPSLMLMPGSSLGGVLGERMGPRTFLLFLTPSLIASMAVMHIASYKQLQDAGVAETILLISRVFQAFVCALMSSVVSVYICEVAEERLRGVLASLVDAWATLGFLLTYVAGSYLEWPTLALVLPMGILLPAFIGLLASQESPLWLARKGREKEALAALQKLRRSPEEATADFTGVRTAADIEEQVNCCDSLRTLLKRSNIVPILVSMFLLQAKEFAGNNAILIFMPQVFRLAGVGLAPSTSSIVVTAARLGCNFVGSTLLHLAPRKMMMSLGAVLVVAASAGIGSFFFMQVRGDDVSWLSWLPLTSLVTYTVGMSVGVGPASWLVSAEILPNRVRSLGFSIGITGYSLASFLVSMTFEDVREAWGSHGIFFSYAGGGLVYLLHVLLFVPETKGRSLNEIEERWTK